MGQEKNIENHIKTDLAKHHYWYTKVFANGFTKKGVPDILAVINGQLIALEIKRPTGGKPTPIQIQNLKNIADNQGLALITNDPHIVEQIPQLQKQHPIENVFNYYPEKTLTPPMAAHIWQHPQDQSTPKQPYSVLIQKEEN